MWCLETIVRMNDEAIRAADVRREERRAKEARRKAERKARLEARQPFPKVAPPQPLC